MVDACDGVRYRGLMGYWIYILECTNGAYYTGYTTDIMRRYQEHLTGSAKCKYTRSFKPLRLAQCWRVSDKAMAIQAELFIKKMNKNQKQQLIRNPEMLMNRFDCSPEGLL